MAFRRVVWAQAVRDGKDDPTPPAFSLDPPNSGLAEKRAAEWLKKGPARVMNATIRRRERFRRANRSKGSLAFAAMSMFDR